MGVSAGVFKAGADGGSVFAGPEGSAVAGGVAVFVDVLPGLDGAWAVGMSAEAAGLSEEVFWQPIRASRPNSEMRAFIFMEGICSLFLF